mgnify:CR=1 FL=1|jgi:hypothetical protein
MNTKNETAIAVVERPQPALMRPVATPSELVEHHKTVVDLIGQALQQGQDYGVIPGTQKPTLLKPGAERLCVAFGCAPHYEVVESEVDHDREVQWSKKRWEWGAKRGEKIWSTETGTSLGLYRYVVRCRLVRRETGDVAAEGIGSCSTMESKYVDRPRDMENTVIKMAQKRAFVAAVLNAFGLSDRFTQDMEDEPREARPKPKPAADLATVEQVEFIRKLLGSHVVYYEEREKMETAIGRGLTKAQASKALDGLQTTIAERKAAEATAATAPDEGSQEEPGEAPERVPGEDDDVDW